MTKINYALTVSFPLRIATMIEDTERADAIVGQRSWSAGSDFGIRDCCYDFDSAEEREAAVKRALDAGYDVTEYEEEAWNDN